MFYSALAAAPVTNYIIFGQRSPPVDDYHRPDDPSHHAFYDQKKIQGRTRPRRDDLPPPADHLQGTRPNTVRFGHGAYDDDDDVTCSVHIII